MQTQRAERTKQEAKRSKEKAAGFAFAATSADAYAGADCAADVRL